MKGEKLEQWKQLCELAAIEQDPKRLIALVREINRLLEEKEQRLKHSQQPTSSNTKAKNA
jgi:hypothetical protein